MKNIAFLLLFLSTLMACQEAPKPLLSNEQSEILYQTIMTRRSIRQFTEQQIERSKLDTILKAAIHAPSANNKQPWEVRVIQNKALIEKINQRYIDDSKRANPDAVNPRWEQANFSVFYHAPTVLVFAGDKENKYAQHDIGLMVENVLLMAHGMGLGTCPIGGVVKSLSDAKNADIYGLLKMPETHEVVVCVALGYPKEAPKVKERYAERIKIID